MSANYSNVEFSNTKNNINKLRRDNTLVFTPSDLYYEDIKLFIEKNSLHKFGVSEPDHKKLNFYGDIKTNVLIVILRNEGHFIWWKIRTKKQAYHNSKTYKISQNEKKQILKKSFIFKPYWDAYTLVIEAGQDEESLKEFIWSNRVYLKYHFENLISGSEDYDFYKKIYNNHYSIKTSEKVFEEEDKVTGEELESSNLGLSTIPGMSPSKRNVKMKKEKKVKEKKTKEKRSDDKMSKEEMLKIVASTKKEFNDNKNVSFDLENSNNIEENNNVNNIEENNNFTENKDFDINEDVKSNSNFDIDFISEKLNNLDSMVSLMNEKLKKIEGTLEKEFKLPKKPSTKKPATKKTTTSKTKNLEEKNKKN